MTQFYPHMRKTAIAACAAVAAMGMTAAPAMAWEPEKEVELIIHASPTSSTNVFVRQVEKEFDKLLPEGANAQNMPGAGGDRARRYVLDHKGDPYVIGSLTPSNVNNPILHGADYGVDDFTPLAVMVVSPLLVVVNADSDYKTLDDIIQAAKKNPGKVVQGGGDVGETDSLHHVMLKEMAGVDMAFSPFESKGVIELLGGHVDLIMVNPAQANKYVESGDFRVVAASAKLKNYPDVPTFAEAGYDIPLLKQYRGLWMSSDIPEEVQQYYIDQLKKVSESDSFKDYVSKNNLVPAFIAGDELAKMLKEEETNYRKLDEKLGLLKK